MARYELTISTPRPYFAEVPYYLWGTVNYDSEGDCKRPTDCDWTGLELRHRDTDEVVDIASRGEAWTVSGSSPIAARAAKFLAARCAATEASTVIDDDVGDWRHEDGMARARRVAGEFGSEKLAIFDSHLFWGSWKWIGWFATEFTWVGRWIMHSVLTGDPRGVFLCIEWLEHGTCHRSQSKALRTALGSLSGRSFGTDAECVTWYNGGWLRKGAKREYPKPDFEAWLRELKAAYPD
jgi:hypothetical protein